MDRVWQIKKKCMRPKNNRLWHVFKSPKGLFTYPWHIHTQEQKWSVSKGRSLYAATQKWILCGGSYMYSNRHHLNGSSSAPDTHTRKNKSARTKKNQSVRKGWILYAAKKKRVCAADHTSIQIDIACTPLQLLVPHSQATTKQVGQKLGGWMRSNKNWMCVADYT